MNGDQSAFVRSDEVELSWKILKQIKTEMLKLFVYPKGGVGPVEQKELYKK